MPLLLFRKISIIQKSKIQRNLIKKSTQLHNLIGQVKSPNLPSPSNLLDLRPPNILLGPNGQQQLLCGLSRDNRLEPLPQIVDLLTQLRVHRILLFLLDTQHPLGLVNEYRQLVFTAAYRKVDVRQLVLNCVQLLVVDLQGFTQVADGVFDYDLTLVGDLLLGFEWLVVVAVAAVGLCMLDVLLYDLPGCLDGNFFRDLLGNGLDILLLLIGLLSLLF